MTPLADALQHAMTLAQAGQLDRAEAMLHGILVRTPSQSDALQLLGMIERRRGRLDEAAMLFRRSLAVRAAQPHVLNNLGNCLADAGRHDEAVAAYREALACQPNYADAAVNLALALNATGQFAAARDALQAPLRQDGIRARALSALGLALRGLGDLPAAIEAFSDALAARPGHVPTMHNLAVALRLSGRPADALALLFACAAASPGKAEIQYNLGHSLQSLGRIEEAIAAYRLTIALDPTNRDAHGSLSRLLWQQGRQDEHLTSYREALRLHPGEPGLLADLAHRLILSGQAAQAAALVVPVTSAGRGNAELHHRLGQAWWSTGRPDPAIAAFEDALALDPRYAPARREAARASIILGRLAPALDHVAPLLAMDPADQQALALQAIGWRLANDPRAAWLEDPRLIGTQIVAPPEGDIATFNQRLDATLTPLHRAERHPLEQTLRGGTQTTDDLLDRDLPEIAAVRAMLEGGVRRYIAALPDDPAHPFLKRRTRDFAFSGSWSVRLRRAGYHENHIHPEGWISAVYYAALPASVAHGKQGWLKFGESGLRLGEHERLLRMVRPQVGLLVLFPSYFYHGTVPFEDDAHRTTIAFDVVPRA